MNKVTDFFCSRFRALPEKESEPHAFWGFWFQPCKEEKADYKVTVERIDKEEIK